MRTRLEITIFLIIGALVFGACRKQSGNQTAANNSAPAAQEAPAGGPAQAGEKFFFRGTIAGNLSIEMTLVRDG